MSVYQPTYRDPKTGELKKSKTWWYDFTFAGRRIQESAKTTKKTLAKEAEKQRRSDLERGFNAVEDRRERIRTVGDIAATYLSDYKLRHLSHTFAEYAIGHLTRLCGKTMSVDISTRTVKDYQTARLKEKAAEKTINEEVGFLLRMLGEQGDALRMKLKREKSLKLKPKSRELVAKAFTLAQRSAMLAKAKAMRSPAIFPALTLALNCGLRDAELRGLQWGRVDMAKALLTVGAAKTDAGTGRVIPLNSEALAAMVAHEVWYRERFGEIRPEWYVFPFGQPQPTEPARPVTTFKTAWSMVKAAAGVKGRWHDARHTFVTNLAESGQASDETIRTLAGHVSAQMMRHYSHIGTEARRRAVEAISSVKDSPKVNP